MKPRFISRSTVAVLILLLAAVALVRISDCGGGPEDPAARTGPSYHLDPPALAPGGFPPAADGVPVFCYHYFRSGFDGAYLLKVLGSVLLGMPALGPREFWTTPIGEFEKHLRYFRDTGTRVMTLDEVADLVDAGRPLPGRAVVLTIDDADRSVYELAFPLLRKYGMKAHLFVPTAQAGRSWSDLEVCTWDQLAEMEASGTILVGSHTRDLHFKVEVDGELEPVFFHPDRMPAGMRARNLEDVNRRARSGSRGGISPDLEEILTGNLGAVAADLAASRMDIAAGTGASADWLAWPYGFASDELDSLSRAVGFRGSVSLFPVAVTPADSTLHLGRFALTAKTTLGHIAAVFPR